LCGLSYLVKMIAILQTSLLLVAWAQCLSATALDDYVWRADSNYGWVDMVSFFQGFCVATYLLNFDGDAVITGTGLHFYQQSWQASLYRYGK
jgi:hypothetical protein